MRAYDLLLRVMFLIAPERIHHLAFAAMRLVTTPRSIAGLIRRILTVDDVSLGSTVFGVRFPNPVGLAAGFDKDASGADVWGPLGFGFAEVGTVTAQPQPGNPAPRLFRMPADRALINRMGFNNYGAMAAAARLARRRPDVPIGANIGKTKIVDPEFAAADYASSAKALGSVCDFVVVNVSSPNTPGLRDLQAVESLRPILAAVLAEVQVPVLVKIAPDLSNEDVDAVADLAVDMGLAGIVATNTTISRAGLATPAHTIAEIGPGGLSGPPVAARSVEVLRQLYSRVGGRLALISVGGIESADDAWERILAGANLVQGYTGFIYGGPFWARRINRGVAERLRASGLGTLAEAVGSGVTDS